MRRRAIIWKRVSSCIAITVSMGALAPVSAQQAPDEAQNRQRSDANLGAIPIDQQWA